MNKHAKYRRAGNALVMVLLVASLFMGLTGALGTQLISNLGATKHRLDASSARYAAYAGLQHAMFELKKDPNWGQTAGDELIGVPLGTSNSMGYTVEITNNTGLSTSATAPDGTEVPGGEIYLVTIGIMNDKEATRLHAMTGRISSNAPVLDHAAYADTDLNLSGQSKALSYDGSTTFDLVDGKAVPSVTGTNGDVGSNRYSNLSGTSEVKGQLYHPNNHEPVYENAINEPSEGEIPLDSPTEIPDFAVPARANFQQDSSDAVLGTAAANTSTANVRTFAPLSVPAGTSREISPGKYYFPDGIDVGGTLSVGPTVDEANPVVFFVGNDANFHTDAKVNQSGPSKQFQIYFVDHNDGTAQEFVMDDDSQVFATVAGDTAEGVFRGDAQLFGGFIGRSVNATEQAMLFYDETLRGTPLNLETSLSLRGIAEPQPSQILVSYPLSRDFVDDVEAGVAVYGAAVPAR